MGRYVILFGMNTYTAVYQKHENWYVAWVEEIPGANTQAETLAEAKENLKDALSLVLDVNRRMTRREAPRGRKIRERVRVPSPV